MKNASRGYSRDMSPPAINRRLDIVVELNRLCEWLGKGRPIGRVEDLKKVEAKRSDA